MKLNLKASIILSITLIFLLILDVFISVNVNLYYAIIGPLIAAIGNYIVERTRETKSPN